MRRVYYRAGMIARTTPQEQSGSLDQGSSMTGNVAIQRVLTQIFVLSKQSLGYKDTMIQGYKNTRIQGLRLLTTENSIIRQWGATMHIEAPLSPSIIYTRVPCRGQVPSEILCHMVLMTMEG